MDLSIVIPLLNEEDNIPPLYQSLKNVLDGMAIKYEIIIIDDGSTDRSYEILEELAAKDKSLKVIRFRRNFGQTAGLAAGFDEADGDVVITMDADLQNDPQDIPKLVEKINEGYDLVAGWRYDRQDAEISRKLPSRIANALISKTTDVKLHDYGCTLKAFRKEVVKNINLYGELHRFIPAIASWMGVRIAEVKVNHHARIHGESKYNISRTPRVLLDLFTVKFLLSYSAKPLQFFGKFGLITGGVGFLMMMWLILQRLFTDTPLSDKPSLLIAIMLILVGVQFISFGLLGEMMTRTYHETQEKSVYVVRDILNG